MKAILFTKYGSVEDLELQEVDKPTPKDSEVLIKMHAASVNSWDWDLMRGNPFINRVLFGLQKPKIQSLGCDVAGKVEAVGKNVTKFQQGDEVFGDLSGGNWGAFAEYVCANEKSLTIKPTSLTFEQVASLPQAAVMALQGIYDHGKVQPGQKVLINGGGGGVGTFAIQMAKLCGAEVTGVDSGQKFEMMRSLGADHVIDYTREDFTKNGQGYDFILDVVGHHSIYDFKRALNPGGMYRMVGGHPGLIFQAIFIAPIISMFSGKKMGILAHKQNKGLEFILALIEEDKLKPIIDKCFPLHETAEALQHLGEGRSQGKVVITM